MRLALILGLLAGAAWGQEQTGVLEGQLYDSASGTPIAGAKVTLRAVTVPGTPAAFRDRKTDAAGAFRFEGLAAGAYEASFYKVGYVDSSYFGGPVQQVRVKPATDPTPIAVHLVPTGTVEGRVLDEDGMPIKGVLLYAERPNAPGILAIAEEGGRFRLEYLPPGQFRMEVRVPYPLRKETARRNPDTGGMDGYPNTQFHPGVEDVQAAALVPVAAGTVLRGFDIRLARVPLVELSGRALDAATREPVVGAEVELAPAAGGLTDNTYERRPLAADGSFRFDLIRPGKYSLLFYRDKGDKESPHVTSVEVGRTGLCDHVERLPALTRLAGRIVTPPGKAAEWGHVRVTLSNPAVNGQLRDVETTGDGTFSFDRVAPGRWRIGVMQVRGFTRPWYLSAIHFGQQDVVKAILNVAEGENPVLEIVLGADAAQVAGAVVDSKGQASAKAMVLAQGASGSAAFQSVSADGAFTIPGLAPGEYALTAVPSAEASDWLTGDSRTCGVKTVRLQLGANERRVVQLELCAP